MALALQRGLLPVKTQPKETKYVSFTKPPDDLTDTQEQAEEIEERFRRRALDLSEDDRADLEKRLFYEVVDWKDSRSSLKTKLRDLNDLYEGVVKVTDFPWQGSCYDKETEVLTFQGWKFFKNVTKEDFVYSFNPKTGLCSYQPISAVQKFKAKEIICFVGKSLDIAVTGNHNIFVWSGLSEKHEFIKAEQLLKIRGHEFKIPIAFNGWRAKSVETMYGFDAEDWMSLLGWYISEGYSQCLNNSHYPQVVICQSKEANEEKCDEIEELLKRMKIGFKFDGTQYHLEPENLPQEARLLLKSLGHSHQKFIPRHYLNHSQDLLAPLLESLIKGDGHVILPGRNSFRKQESFVYYTVSKQLADDVQELAQKLGFNASIKLRCRQGEGGKIRGRKINSIRDGYEVSIGLKNRIKVGQLQREVVPYNDFVYCVTTTFHTLLVRRNGKAAWCGNSQLHIPIPKVKAREIKSTINRNTMRPIPFLMTHYAGPADLYSAAEPVIRDIEDFVEDKIKNDTNIHQVLKDAIIPTIRDGTCPIQIIWETELERVTDYKIYSSVSDFLKDYPSADTAGISDQRFSKILSQLRQNKQYEVQYEYDLATYDGPKAYIVPLIHFFHWPVFETEIGNMLTHGKRVWYTDYDLEKFVSIGKFDKDAVEKILKSPGDRRDDESLTISRDVIDGIVRNPTKLGVAREYEFYELVHKVDLDGDGVKEKYLINYHWKTRKIVRIERYPIRKGALTYFPLRLIKRDNRFLGISLIEDIADLSLEIDLLHRMRINSRTITHVPSFKAKATAKDMFDPSRPAYRFKPGVTFYLNSVDDVEQFDIRPVDLSGSIEEENFLFQLVGLVTGSDSGLSGQSNPLDPRAPARKQQELLRQSSNRIDDYVEALLGPFEQIGQFMLDLYYQFGEDRIKYYVAQEDGAMLQKELDRSRLYNPNVMFKVNGTSVFLNPDMEFDRVQEISKFLMELPVTAQDPMIQTEIAKRVLDAARVKDTKNLMPRQATAGALGVPTQAGGSVIPTPEDKMLSMKLSLQKEKAAARLSEGQVKRQHDKDMEVLRSILAPAESQVPQVADAA